MERGNRTYRALDRMGGIPLVAVAGMARRAVRVRSVPANPRLARRVTVLSLGAIGDLLLATGLLKGLRACLPETRIEVFTSRANAGCGPLLPPGVAVRSFALTDFGGMTRALRESPCDVLFDTGQWARYTALLAACSGAGRTVGFATRGQYRHYGFDLAVEHRNDRHEVGNFLALGRAVFPDLDGKPGIEISEAPDVRLPYPLETTVFCHMWSAGIMAGRKEWPSEYWSELARGLAEAGLRPVFTGGMADRKRTEAFVRDLQTAGVEPAVSVAGELSLADLAWHFQRAAAVVAVNTGILHLASLSGAPTVELNGPVAPSRWRAVGQKTVTLMPEHGRTGYIHLGFEDGPDDGAMRHLRVETVMEALRFLGLPL